MFQTCDIAIVQLVMCSGDMCVRAAPTGHASIGHLLMVVEQVSDSRGGRNTLHAANNTPKRSRGVSQS